MVLTQFNLHYRLHVYKRALNDVKMVLYSEQFGHEVTSSRFCAVYNLDLKLLQDVFASSRDNVKL